MYSLSHCLASIPNMADPRLSTRLKNHRALLATAYSGTTNASVPGEGTGGSDEFESWWEICAMVTAIVSELSG